MYSMIHDLAVSVYVIPGPGLRIDDL